MTGRGSGTKMVCMEHRWQPRDVVPAALAGVLLPIAARAVQRFGQHRSGGPDGLIDAGGIALIALAAVALLWRRRSPVLAAGGVAIAMTAYLWLGYPYGPPMLTILVAVYSLAAHRPVRVSLIAAAAAGLVLLSHTLRDITLVTASGVAFAVTWFVLAFTVGVAVRTVREGRARAREEVLRQHLDSERLSLSRDVHDVVGHGLAAINMQARVALRSVDRDDEHGRRRVRESLEAISTSSAAALDELRGVLTRMPADGGDSAPRRPAPGLADLPALAARLERTGLRVVIDERGNPVPLDVTADLAAYRVAQEALTNALRHGEASAAVEVTIEHQPDAVVLEVSNGVGPRPGQLREGGMGIPGMRDRVAAVGGALEIDPGPPRFVVRATIPTEESA